MSTQNVFLLKNKKNIDTFWLKKKTTYQEGALYMCLDEVLMNTITFLHNKNVGSH